MLRTLRPLRSLSPLRVSSTPIRSVSTSSMSSSSSSSLLISPATLSSLRHDSSLRILDATWFMPNVPRKASDEFLKGPRIEEASGFWDVDAVADRSHPLGLGHMMPSPEVFAKACGKLGIRRDSKVVVYDTHGIFSAPRTVFTFKAFGHPEAYVLDGGLPRWIAEGHPTESGEFKQRYPASEYPTPQLDESVIRSYEQISNNTTKEQDEAELVLDARPAGRFTGEAPEPRAGLSSGHMPNSVSLPFSSLLSQSPATDSSPAYSTLLPPSEIKAVLLKALKGDENRLEEVLGGKRNLVNSCGSGMTAAVIWLALQELGIKSAIYDESWTGYAMRKESKILKGSDN